jgi:chromosome segregation ATPase
MKWNIISWVVTLTLPVMVLMGIYFFFTSRFERADIGKVRVEVGENRRDILDNRARGEHNAGRLDRVEEAVADHEERLGAAEEAVAGNAEEIGKNREELGAMRRRLDEKIAALEGEVARLRTARDEELAFRKDAIRKMEELRTEIGRILAKMEETQRRNDERLGALESKEAEAKE